MFNNKGGISFIFILVGIISVFYCIKRIYEGDFLLINFSDCGLLFLFLMTSIFIIFAGLFLIYTELKKMGSNATENRKGLFIFKIIKSFWYPDEYYDRKNNHTLFNKIKRYIGFLIIFISVYLFMVITFFASNRLSLLEIIIRIVAMLYILMCCMKYLM